MIRTKLIRTALATFLLAFATDASAQAFGVEKGTQLDNLEGVQELQPFYYAIEVPKPHSEFLGYSAFATPETGVCKVLGISKQYENDRYGADVRRAYSTLHGALEGIYGAHINFDFIKYGALWDDADEWVMSIRQNERFYSDFWNEESEANLSEGLLSISLKVKAASSDTSYILLTYEFDNFDECSRIMQSKNEDGL